MSETNVGHGVAEGESSASGRRARSAGRRLREDPSYLEAGPHRLAKTPAKIKRRPYAVDPNWAALKHHAESRINLQRAFRSSWMTNYQMLEAYIQPRRGIFINTSMPTPNQMSRGVAINQNIVDPTGTYAARRCAAGLMSNEMSPSRQWFKLRPALFEREEAAPDAVGWFEEVEKRLHIIMARSNFYNEGAQMVEDLVIFGTSPMIIYEDWADVVRCYTPVCGEYFLSSSAGNRVGTFARVFVMTIAAIVEMFGLENCPTSVQEMWASKGGSLEVELLVAHMIEPNAPIDVPGYDHSDGLGVVDGEFDWRETYWCWGKSDQWPLSVAGFKEPPFICPRWAVTSNDAYGRSVGMDVFPDILQLQVMTARLAEAQEKMVRPPMLASIEMKNQPASVLPGKVTFVAKLSPETGMRPAYTVNPEVREFAETMEMTRQRIREGFYNDLFALLEQTKKDMTAYEVAARNQEKLQLLGPVVERLQSEGLAPAVKRIFHIAWRRGLLPPLPPSLHGVQIGIQFEGVLSLAAKASISGALTEFANQVNAQMQLHPEVGDAVDMVAWTREFGEALFIPKKIIRSDEETAARAAARQKQQAEAQAMMAAQHASATAKNLGQSDIGGGATALGLLTGFGTSGNLMGAQPAGSA